jgi:NAD(P)-dependent dehydrogenase (short-subunit alcohol dehydrogenase family)
MARLDGKHALVTGGTSGIGLETARRLLAEGARVAITGSRAETVAAARADLGPEIVGIVSDAGSVKDQARVAAAVKEALGPVDIAVLNAGIGDFRPLDAWDEAGFDRSFAVNLKGPFFLVQALLPMLANPASVILTASINAHIGMPNSSVYAATKAGLISLARTLSGELMGRGIRFNAVSPGPIATPLHEKIGMGKDDIRSLVGQVPAGRRGDPAEVAEAIVFLASKEGAFTVGSEFIIDGGMSTL